MLNTLKLHIFLNIYNALVYRDPFENWPITRWAWRRLSAAYDRVPSVC